MVIGIMGESGSGKTTAMRNLDPKTTYYIDCDKKGLSWKGWREQYSAENKNYIKTDYQQIVTKLLYWLDGKEVNEKEDGTKETKEAANKDGLKFKTVVIDTLNGIMVSDEVRRMKQKGYDKWVDLAQCVWEILDIANTLRNDLTVIIICHSQTQKEDDGYTMTRIKTSGKKLDKLNIESKLTTVLHCEAVNGSYVFHTHANNSTTKTPLDSFDKDDIPNDIVEVIKALKDY